VTLKPWEALQNSCEECAVGRENGRAPRPGRARRSGSRPRKRRRQSAPTAQARTAADARAARLWRCARPVRAERAACSPAVRARLAAPSCCATAPRRLPRAAAKALRTPQTAKAQAMPPVAAKAGRAALPGVWFGPSVFKSTSGRTRQGARPNEGSRAPHAERDAPPKAGPERDALGDHQKN